VSAARIRGAFAALLLAAALPALADRDVRIGLPSHGALFLKMPDDWQERISREKPNEPPLIEITPASGATFRIVLSPVWPESAEDKLPDAEAIRTIMQTGAKAAKAESVEKDIAVQDVRGMQALGSYFSATDKDPAPGDFLNLTQGLVRLGEICVAFRVFSNGPRSVVLEPALKMVRLMRHG
jgi:hypothetical protein